ncbi:hypothetical protein HW555_005840 [Spodoptera exigua]|uniref:Sodium-independent sulfate anion transporter n=1 Tax=Spodoptera exigua TaxID=7107 RepID=A0A835LAN9_SPOEX|nr:hypothetical protein HW555_005840 [Spodoptera exigua]
MIPRRKHNASSGSLPPPDDKHASNDYILTDSEARCGWRAALRRRFNRKTLHKRLPVTSWLPQYNAEKAVGDLIAGITVGLTVIPQSLAYSNIAGLPPQYGLYGSFLGCFVYIVLGGCRAVPAGPTAIASLLTYQVAGGVVEKAILLAFLAGLVELLMGVLGLGFLINFVSGPVSSGFTSAVALMIATSQVKDLFAISVSGTTFLQQWISIFRNLHAASLWDPVLGFSCIALLLIMRKIGMIKLGEKSEDGPSTRQKVISKCLWMVSTCRNAIVVVATGLLGFWFVATYGQPPVRLMGTYVRADNSTADFLDMVSEMGSGLLVIPLIVLLEDIAICKAFSDGRTIDATQEMIALGVAGIANSFMQAYPGGGSLARSVVSNGSGVKTTLNGLYTGVMVILALQFFTQYFEYIPKAALAAVIVSAILFMVEYNVIKPMWRAKKLDLIPGTEHGVEYLMITPDRCLMFPSVDYVRRLVTKHAASSSVPVVIECTHIYSADYTAAKSIEQLTADFHARRQPLYFYNVKPSVCSIFEAVAKPEHFVVFYEDEELDRLLAADERLEPAKLAPPLAPA